MQGPVVPMQLSTLTLVISDPPPDPRRRIDELIVENNSQMHVSENDKTTYMMLLGILIMHKCRIIYCVPFGVISANSGGSTVLLLISSKL